MNRPDRRLRGVVATAALALVLAHAKSTPGRPPVLDLPPMAGAELDLARWWTAFDDPGG